MERLEKIQLAIEKGITCNPETGEIYNKNRQKIGYVNGQGYIAFGIRIGPRKDNKIVHLRAHQFIYYIIHNRIVDIIDHINGIKTDNRGCNLREVNPSQNICNQQNVKGAYYDKRKRKYKSSICINRKSIFLGLFDTEKEAHKAYLDAKKIYHKI